MYPFYQQFIKSSTNTHNVTNHFNFNYANETKKSNSPPNWHNFFKNHLPKFINVKKIINKKITHIRSTLYQLINQIKIGKRLIHEKLFNKSFFNLSNQTSIKDPPLFVKTTDKREEWVASVITKYKITREDASKTVIRLKLLPNQYLYYCDLQKKIAELIPEEEYRPTIDLEISGKEGTNKKISDFAIIGGVGPLSDSELLKQIIKKLESNQEDLSQLKIRLLSAPPPRRFIHQLITLPKYLFNLRTFLHEKHKNTYIASNTAHLHFKAISMISANPVYNLTHHIVKQINAKEKVFVLGTTLAWQKKLYPKLLQERRISFIEVENKAKQALVQTNIDMTKRGETINNFAQKLFEEIKEHHQKYKWSCLLLSCTELPLALKEYKSKLKELGITILDTEEMFSSIIVDKLITNP